MKKFLSLLALMLLGSIGAVAQTIVTSPRVSTATTTYEYTLECKSNAAHSATRFIGLNEGSIYGQCASANALKFQFETATGGYHIFTTVQGEKKYFNFGSGGTLDATATTTWEIRAGFIANCIGLAPVGTATNKALNNNGNNSGGSSLLQLWNFESAGNACSHWEMKEYATNANSVYGTAGSIGVSPAMQGGNFVNGTKFYTIAIKRDNGMLDSRYLPVVNNKQADPCDENKWAIIEATGGYQFVNKATKEALTFASSSNNAAAAKTTNYNDANSIFVFTTSQNSNFESGFELFRIAGSSNAYPNSMSSGLAVWTSDYALWGWGKSNSDPGNGDEGSKFKFTMVEELSIETPSTEINFEDFPATTAGTYYVTFTGQATNRPNNLYNDLTQPDGYTLQHDGLPSPVTNNYIWKVESDGNGNFTNMKNGQGGAYAMKIRSGSNPTINSLQYAAHGGTYYLKTNAAGITGGHNCLNVSNSFANAAGTKAVTTWQYSQESGNAPDNHWDIQCVDMTGITEYTVQVTGASNGYAIYNGQNAADGGFFLVNGEIAGVQAADIPGLNGNVSIDGHTVKVNYTDPLASYVPDPLPFLAANSVNDDDAAFYYLKEKNTGHYIKMDGDNIKESKESSDAIMMISAGGSLFYIYDVTTQKYLAYRSTAEGSTTASTSSSRVYATTTPSNECLWRVIKDGTDPTTHVDIIPGSVTTIADDTPALNFTGGTGNVLNLYRRNDTNCGWQFELDMTANELDAPNVLYATPGAAYMHKLITKDGTTVTSVTGLDENGLSLQLGERSASTYARNYKYVHGNAPAATGTYHYNVQLSNGKSTQVELIVKDDLQQPTPFMGLLTWNAFQNNISQDIIIKLAEDIVKYDLDDVGYKYMCIDDGWANSNRTGDHMVWNTGKFNDYTQIVSAVHNLGLKIGLYSDAAGRTCSGAMPGSYGYEDIDAADFVSWGFDLLKYDFCGNEGAGDTEANAIYRYKRMSDALNNAMTNAGKNPKDFLFYMCNWGHNAPWKWGHQTGASCWRATEDTRDIWSDTAHNGGLIQSINRFKNIWAWQGVNRWSDADMMCIGLHATGYSSNDGSAPGYSDGLNEEEEKTQMALWCMWSSPLTLSNNIDNLDGQPNNLTGKDVTNEHYAKDLEIIKNTRLIALDQDEMGQGAEPIVDADGILVFQKDLANGDVAISITNVSDAQKSYTLPFNKISALTAGNNYKLNDLWTGEDVQVTYTTESSHNVTLAAHATAIYRISIGEPDAPQFPNPNKKYRIKNHAAGKSYTSGSTTITIGYLKDEEITSPTHGQARTYGFSAMGDGDCEEGIFVFVSDGEGHYYLKSESGNNYVKALVDGALPAVTTTDEAAAFTVTTTDGSYTAAEGTYFLIDSKATNDKKYLQACDAWWGGGAAAWYPQDDDNKLRCEWIIEEYDADIKPLQEKINNVYAKNGLIGYPSDMESLADYFGDGVNIGNKAEAIAALNALYATNEINLPEDGKAYYISAVHVGTDGMIADHQYLYSNAEGQITTAADAKDNQTYNIFVAKREGDGIVLVNELGNYLCWFDGSDSGKSHSTKGSNADYSATHNVLTLEHANTTSTNNLASVLALTDLQRFGALQIKGKQENGTTDQYMVVDASNNNAKHFVSGSSGNKFYGATSHTFLFMFEEVENQNVEKLTCPSTAFSGGLNGKFVGTFSAPYDVKLPTGVEAYIGKVAENGSAVVFTSIGNVVPKNTGVLLYAEGASANISECAIPAATADIPAIAAGANIFLPTGREGATLPEGSLILGKGDKGVGFYKVNPAKNFVARNKAYIPADAASSVARYAFDFEEGTLTGIEGLEAGSAESTTIFDLQGRRVQNAQKGLYIANGKKVMR